MTPAFIIENGVFNTPLLFDRFYWQWTMKIHTLMYSNPLSAILEDFFSIRFKPHQVVTWLFWHLAILTPGFFDTQLVLHCTFLIPSFLRPGFLTTGYFDTRLFWHPVLTPGVFANLLFPQLNCWQLVVLTTDFFTPGYVQTSFFWHLEISLCLDWRHLLEESYKKCPVFQSCRAMPYFP